MGQISMKIRRFPGSVLGGNQQLGVMATAAIVPLTLALALNRLKGQASPV